MMVLPVDGSVPHESPPAAVDLGPGHGEQRGNHPGHYSHDDSRGADTGVAGLRQTDIRVGDGDGVLDSGDDSRDCVREPGRASARMRRRASAAGAELLARRACCGCSCSRGGGPPPVRYLRARAAVAEVAVDRGWRRGVAWPGRGRLVRPRRCGMWLEGYALKRGALLRCRGGGGRAALTWLRLPTLRARPAAGAQTGGPGWPRHRPAVARERLSRLVGESAAA